ncbi:DoxX family protein [Amycolatopsis anabasis]|uniref:DoxX family protein n=1 Tax=Amycolatopsis anabasis TaxID=1840409 RepID=UPI00131E77FF|nr:DoxX family protein [Amycolatopsis anabasis]
MFTAYLVVTIVTAAGNAVAAAMDLARVGWVVDNMTKYGIPHSWLLSLGLLKAAGAAGLLLGFAVPPLGLAAAAGLVAYFAGAIFTVVRARCYAHLPFPAVPFVLAAGSLLLHIAAV